MFQHNMRICY